MRHNKFVRGPIADAYAEFRAKNPEPGE
jgi:hypothetical protein